MSENGPPAGGARLQPYRGGVRRLTAVPGLGASSIDGRRASPPEAQAFEHARLRAGHV